MLVLSRRQGEQIAIGENIQVLILKVKGDKVRIAIQAPYEVAIRRAELPAKSSKSEEATIPVPSEDRLVLLPFEPRTSVHAARGRRHSPLGEFIEANSIEAKAIRGS